MVKVKHQESYTNNNNNNNNNNNKSQLAIDIYNLYKKSHISSCVHINNVRPPFIDWYLILRVGEDASIVTLRQQYHKLALLLHPDKNKHPKAEFSFKLISQAYECLSDNGRRSSFNLERRKNKCTKCNQIPHPAVSPPQRKPHTDKRGTVLPRKSISLEIQDNFRVLREKLKEEARVIENCMRLNRASKTEYPVFNPSNYANIGYPHRRNQPFPDKKDDSSCSLQKENVNMNYDQRRNGCEIPVFELRTDCRNINSACVGSS